MLKIFNTLFRQIEEFKPIEAGKVGMYTCGPTVYNFAHIGNMRAYIFADILKRVLLFDGYDVKHVINITDVGHLTGDGDEGEDKIEKSARLELKSAWEIADFYMAAFKDDFKKLNILEPSVWARVTDHIAEQIDLIKKLEAKGYTYKISDGIYFDTSLFKTYSDFARLNLQGQEEGARVEINAEKKNPTDFALWKFSPTDEKRQMEWESPWGVGFPGWHLECSAISMKYLGETFDIHTGGIDHIPVHHTNEIAQSEAVTGKRFVNYWVHSDFLITGEVKMAKAEGNFTTLETLIEHGIEPIVYRFFNLSAQYRSKLNFTWDALENAKNSWKKFSDKFMDLGRQDGTVNSEYLQKFTEKINDDLNMPEALAVAYDVLKSDIPDYDKRSTLIKFDEVFGLGLADLKIEEIEVPEEVKKMAEERVEARRNKKFGKSDELRKKINEMGFDVEDTVTGYRINRSN